MRVRERKAGIVSGERQTQQWVIKVDGVDLTSVRSGERLEIGRKPLRPLLSNGIVRLEVPDETRSMSKRHALFSVNESGTATLRDLHSTNGTYVVQEQGGLARLPIDADFVLPSSLVHVQFGDVPVDFMRMDVAQDVQPNESVTDLFDYAANGARQEPDASDMSVDEILDLRAGEPTSMFRAQDVRQQAQQLHVDPLDAVKHDLPADLPDAAIALLQAQQQSVEESLNAAQDMIAASAVDGDVHAPVAEPESRALDVGEVMPSIDVPVVAPAVEDVAVDDLFETGMIQRQDTDAATAAAPLPDAPMTNAPMGVPVDGSGILSTQESPMSEEDVAVSDGPVLAQDWVERRTGPLPVSQEATLAASSVTSSSSSALAPVAAAASEGMTVESASLAVSQQNDMQPQAMAEAANPVPVESVASVSTTSLEDLRGGEPVFTALDDAPQTDDMQVPQDHQAYVQGRGQVSSVSQEETYTPAFEPGSVFERVSKGEFAAQEPVVEVEGLHSDDAKTTTDFSTQFAMARHPELLPFLAMNPSLYDDLYAWLAAQGNQDIDDALSRNSGYDQYRRSVGK